MITLLMHAVNGNEHVAQHASEEWLDSLRNGRPVTVREGNVMVQTGTISLSFQCLGCNRILQSNDVTDGETYEVDA